MTPDDQDMNENGLKCLLDIVHKIENDRSDGTYKGDLLNDGTHKDNMKLNKLFKMGVDQGIDITTQLLQYYNLEDKDIRIADGSNSFQINLRKGITDCNLNLEHSIKRCKYAYRNLKGATCERVRWGGNSDTDMAPFVTLSCPAGYKRYGCCKCLRGCNHKALIHEESQEWTGHDYCMKKGEHFSSRTKNIKKLTNPKNWEKYKGRYVKKCKPGFRRLGDYRCLAECPLGWPDLGDRCQKKGGLIVFPFVWQVGDGNSDTKSKKERNLI